MVPTHSRWIGEVTIRKIVEDEELATACLRVANYPGHASTWRRTSSQLQNWCVRRKIWPLDQRRVSKQPGVLRSLSARRERPTDRVPPRPRESCSCDPHLLICTLKVRRSSQETLSSPKAVEHVLCSGERPYGPINRGRIERYDMTDGLSVLLPFCQYVALDTDPTWSRQHDMRLKSGATPTFGVSMSASDGGNCPHHMSGRPKASPPHA